MMWSLGKGGWVIVYFSLLGFLVIEELGEFRGEGIFESVFFGICRIILEVGFEVFLTV